MPGGIDTHVHLEHPVDRIGIETADDFFSGSVAAACGGTTTLVDFALQRKGDDLEKVSTERAELAGGKSIVDFGLHIILTDIREETPRQMTRAVEQGFTSFKIYMTYADKYVDDASLLRILETNAASGGLTYLHCENDCAVTHLIHSHLSRGDTEARFHAPSRPPIVEAEATYRAIALAEITRAPICIAHVTSERALGNIEKARYEGAQSSRKRARNICCSRMLATTTPTKRPSSYARRPSVGRTTSGLCGKAFDGGVSNRSRRITHRSVSRTRSSAPPISRRSRMECLA